MAAIHRDGDAQRMCDAFVEALGRQSVPLDGAVEAVRRWSAKIPVVIVTNGIAQVQRGRMAKSELKPYISGLVISEEVGAAKPNPLMLEKGMELAQATDKRRALMLGDSLTSDIAAAKNGGLTPAGSTRRARQTTRACRLHTKSHRWTRWTRFLTERREA